MLISLSDDFSERLDALKVDSRLVAALRNLALAAREGKHVVTGAHHLFDKLMRWEGLGKETCGIFKDLKSKLQSTEALRTRATVVIEVRPHADPPVERRDLEGRSRFAVPYIYFADSQRTQATRLIGENLDDVAVYIAATNAFIAKDRIYKGLHLHVSRVGGGGDTTGAQLAVCAQQGCALCVVDSDKQALDDELGKTARQARGALEKIAGRVVAEVHVLPCHEIENLFPGQLIQDAIDDPRLKPPKPGLSERCAWLREVEVLGSGPSGFHRDLKKGLYLFDVLSEVDSERRRLRMSDFLRLRTQIRAPEDGWCEQAPRCQRREECRCVVWKGVNILKPVSVYLNMIGERRCIEYLFPRQETPVQSTWVRLCERVASWGCAFRPLRA